MEDFLLHGQISEMRTLRVGVSGSSRAHVTWGDRSHDAHVQTVDTHIGSAPIPNTSDSYRYNVAAYRLDRMLDLDMVPVSVRVDVDGVPAALTWWVDDVEMMELDRRKQHVKPPDLHAWNVQMHRSNIFQELVSNSDFNQTNVLITSEWRIWLVDFTRAFRSYPRLRKPELLTRLEPRLRNALERLDETALRREMEALLSKSQIRGILARRDLILEHFDARDATRAAAGAAKVADVSALQEAVATP